MWYFLKVSCPLRWEGECIGGLWTSDLHILKNLTSCLYLFDFLTKERDIFLAQLLNLTVPIIQPGELHAHPSLGSALTASHLTSSMQKMISKITPKWKKCLSSISESQSEDVENAINVTREHFTFKFNITFHSAGLFLYHTLKHQSMPHSNAWIIQLACQWQDRYIKGILKKRNSLLNVWKRRKGENEKH